LWPAPARFDPERFTPENEKQIPRYAYMPFGGGPRVCIGNSFALMEAHLILATLAQRFCFRLAGETAVATNPQVTMSPRGGLPVRVVAR
ncbi:MAG: cytochrome P450, partial [Anaerolineales bacterium]|nr:cytochrome P450 [Anaerolineales bacterium]